MPKIENTKYFALLDELNTSEKLIKLGFSEIQNLSFTEDEKFYFLPFQLLSQGFERIMKAYICLGYYQKYGEFPEATYLRNKLGHNLEKLLNEITNNYYFDYSRPQFELDSQFLRTNSDLRELLSILSDFGRFARYYNFDLITGSSKENINPKDNWKIFEAKVLDLEDNNKLADLSLTHEFNQKISVYIVTIFERFVSALSRQLMFNCLGEQAKQISYSIVFDFGMLYEKNFGKKDYRRQTTKYKNRLKKVHKRTLHDSFHRVLKRDYKSKLILKSEYDGRWPFYANQVVIECREKHWCIVTIDGFDYALNGSAQSRFKLESPHDAGMAILGVSLSNFISMAMEL